MANMAQAIRMALHYAEENLGVTDVFGEDVGPPLGGVFTATQGLKTAWNSPLDERGIIGAAIGLALAGQRPVAEIQFCDYIFNTIDLLKAAGSMHWASYGDWNLPMVVRTPVGSGIRGSLYHSHSFDATMTHIPGWKVVMPSTPLDAYGLLLSACQDPNPVMVLEPKALLRLKGEELLLKSEGRRYRIIEAVRVIREVSGTADPHELVGRVKTRAFLTELGAEILEGSMILGDNAYDVVQGFVGAPHFVRGSQLRIALGIALGAVHFVGVDELQAGLERSVGHGNGPQRSIRLPLQVVGQNGRRGAQLGRIGHRELVTYRAHTAALAVAHQESCLIRPRRELKVAIDG